MNILGCGENLDIFWGSSQNWTILEVIVIHFIYLFLRSIYRIEIFLGAGDVKFQIFLGYDFLGREEGTQ